MMYLIHNIDQIHKLCLTHTSNVKKIECSIDKFIYFVN